MEAITLPIYNTEGKEINNIKLDLSVFDGVINEAAMHQAVNAYRANQRKGLAATKTRGEVSGGGKKPWKQKGTGRARVGSTRSPLWRHGGVVFGPHPRDFSYVLPAKIKSLALKSGLNAKVRENNLIVLDSLKIEKPKVKDALRVFSNLKLINNAKSAKKLSVLLLLDKISDSLRLSLRNISFLNFNLAQDTHVYEVMANKKLVITKDGLTQLINRLKK
ncbi:MAG: 50S ribosomal protein L4 [Candidatus Omnitrophica bacterium CG08_land_8_20_14_0_20_41_16]|nr:MAG: 50S ribosomal protein L4 [Candidatus Omnitrophica bacterium CG08_land_8_20_14_0_20_41_16]